MARSEGGVAVSVGLGGCVGVGMPVALAVRVGVLSGETAVVAEGVTEGSGGTDV